THMYQFRAQNDGTAEIRLATKQISSAFREQIIDIFTGDIINDFGTPKTFNSPLHGAIRVFNNDFVQLGYSDNNYAVAPTSAFAPITVLQPNANAPTTIGESGFRLF